MSRRLFRLAAIVTASLVVVVLLATLFLRLRFESRLEAAESRFREAAGPLEPAAYAPPEVPDPDNVAAWMQAGAAAILVADEDRRLLAELDDRPASEWSERERQEAEALLVELEPALTLLHRGAGLTDSSFGLQYAAGPGMPVPIAGSGTGLISASSLLAVEARLALGRGDLDRALSAARGVERLAAALGHEPIVLFHMLKGAVTRRYLLLLRSILETDPPETALAELAADLDHLESVCAPLSRALSFEATGSYSAWKMGVFAAGPGYEGFRPPWTLRFFRRLIAARTLETFLLLIEVSETPGSLERLPGDRPQRVLPWDLPSYFAASFSDLVRREKLTAAALDLARLAVEVRRAALAEGRYPDSLARLGDPASAPSPLSGEPLLYEPTPAGGVRLAHPEARRWYEEANVRQSELLSWVLPPLSR